MLNSFLDFFITSAYAAPTGAPPQAGGFSMLIIMK
jgi:hypothetical protein